MALAREMAGSNLDSLNVLYTNIFEQYDVDSLWLLGYISNIPHDAEKHKFLNEIPLSLIFLDGIGG